MGQVKLASLRSGRVPMGRVKIAISNKNMQNKKMEMKLDKNHEKKKKKKKKKKAFLLAQQIELPPWFSPHFREKTFWWAWEQKTQLCVGRNDSNDSARVS